jgi:hypothetical protein
MHLPAIATQGNQNGVSEHMRAEEARSVGDDVDIPHAPADIDPRYQLLEGEKLETLLAYRVCPWEYVERLHLSVADATLGHAGSPLATGVQPAAAAAARARAAAARRRRRRRRPQDSGSTFLAY